MSGCSVVFIVGADIQPGMSLAPLGNSVANFAHSRFVPEGLHENSPAFQRREQRRIAQVPKGRLIHIATPLTNGICGENVSRPFGTCNLMPFDPALKRRAIVVCPFGTVGG